MVEKRKGNLVSCDRKINLVSKCRKADWTDQEEWFGRLVPESGANLV